MQCLVQAKPIYYVKHGIKGSKAAEQRCSKKGFNLPSKGLLGVLSLILCTELSAIEPTVNINAPSVPFQNLFQLNQYSHWGDSEAKLLAGPQLILGERNKQQKQ